MSSSVPSSSAAAAHCHCSRPPGDEWTLTNLQGLADVTKRGLKGRQLLQADQWGQSVEWTDGLTISEASKTEIRNVIFFFSAFM